MLLTSRSRSMRTISSPGAMPRLRAISGGGATTRPASSRRRDGVAPSRRRSTEKPARETLTLSAEGGLVTKVPLPAMVRMRPDRSSSRKASRTVARLTPYSSHNWRSEGSRLPVTEAAAVDEVGDGIPELDVEGMWGLSGPGARANSYQRTLVRTIPYLSIVAQAARDVNMGTRAGYHAEARRGGWVRSKRFSASCPVEPRHGCHAEGSGGRGGGRHAEGGRLRGKRFQRSAPGRRGTA